MILGLVGLVSIVLGFIFVFTAEVQTTQYFTGWIFGALALCVGPGLKGVPKIAVTSVAVLFILLHPQTLVPSPRTLTLIPQTLANTREHSRPALEP